MLKKTTFMGGAAKLLVSSETAQQYNFPFNSINIGSLTVYSIPQKLKSPPVQAKNIKLAPKLEVYFQKKITSFPQKIATLGQKYTFLMNKW